MIQSTPFGDVDIENVFAADQAGRRCRVTPWSTSWPQVRLPGDWLSVA